MSAALSEVARVWPSATVQAPAAAPLVSLHLDRERLDDRWAEQVAELIGERREDVSHGSSVVWAALRRKVGPTTGGSEPTDQVPASSATTGAKASY